MTKYEENLQRMISLTRDLMLIPGTAHRAAERQRVIQFITNHLESLDGVEIRRYVSGEFESLVVTPEGCGEPDILMCGHIDVVDHLDGDMYRSKIEEGRIVGPGAGDMKGAVAIMLELFRTIHGERAGASFGLVITSDEEIGSEHGMRYLLEDVGLRCKQAIIPDGGSLNQITVEEKGVLHLELSGCGQSAHAARPWLVRNVLQDLLHVLGEIRAYFAGFYPKETGRDDEHWFPTCSVTNVKTTNDAINCIPDDASAILDIRFPPPHTIESVMEEINKRLKDGITVRVIMEAESTRLNPDPLFVEMTKGVTGEDVGLVKVSGGSDARFFYQQGIPVNLSRPRVGNLHAEGEWIEIDSMLKYYQICYEYITRKLSD